MWDFGEMILKKQEEQTELHLWNCCAASASLGALQVILKGVVEPHDVRLGVGVTKGQSSAIDLCFLKFTSSWSWQWSELVLSEG